MIVEFLAVLLAGFLSSHFSPYTGSIQADGVGYFDYLPSAFIHHDLIRNDNAAPAERIAAMSVYVPYGNGKLNKYHCGTAALLAPFFFAAYIITPEAVTGYEPAFQWSVLIGALFYVFCTLILVRKLLELYAVRRWIIIAIQLTLLFGTNVFYYTVAESAFSHVYSLFVMTAFLFCAKNYFISQEKKYILWMSVLIGLIFIIRPVNVLIVLFLPFLAGSIKPVTQMVVRLTRDLKLLSLSVLLCFGMLSIQLAAWYAQTANWFVYSYGNEGFDFLHPHFFDILFSFRKGLFIYTPILLMAIAGLICRQEKKWFNVLSFVIPFGLLTYVLSAWHDWPYGYGFGLRAYIEFFPLFFILLALGLNRLSGYKNLIWLPIVLCTGLNMFQTWQYKEYILHGYHMDYGKYCKVFLRTSQPFKGILWKEDFDAREFSLDTSAGNTLLTVPSHHCDTLIISNVRDLSHQFLLNKIRLTAQNDFLDDDSTFFDISIFRNSTELIYYRAPYLIHLANGPLNENQTGDYWCNLNGVAIEPSDKVLVRIFTASKPCHLLNFKIDFFSSAEN